VGAGRVVDSRPLKLVEHVHRADLTGVARPEDSLLAPTLLIFTSPSRMTKKLASISPSSTRMSPSNTVSSVPRRRSWSICSSVSWHWIESDDPPSVSTVVTGIERFYAGVSDVHSNPEALFSPGPAGFGVPQVHFVYAKCRERLSDRFALAGAFGGLEVPSSTRFPISAASGGHWSATVLRAIGVGTASGPTSS